MNYLLLIFFLNNLRFVVLLRHLYTVIEQSYEVIQKSIFQKGKIMNVKLINPIIN